MCPRGLKHGEVCLPVLFSLLINELTKEINDNGKHGIQLSPDLIQILILLFADDVALLSDSVIGLQTQLNVLYNVAHRLDLIVNLDRSNVVVFRNGGFLSRNEHWTFGPSQLQSVNMYKYLGVILTTKLSFQPTLLDLAERARKGITIIFRLLWSVGEHSPTIFFKLFDSQIRPILTYGAEIWGLTPNQSVIERVHLSAMKRFLCVSQRTPRHLVYGELGRYPLHVSTYTKCIKFWLRIATMADFRFTKKAYNTLLALQSQNYTTWACRVRIVLYQFGFGFVWEAQSVGSVKAFVAVFKRRLADCFAQDYHAALQSHDFYSIYATYGSSLTIRPYFSLIRNIFVRKEMTRLRVGMLFLRCNFIRFDTSAQNCFCPFCDGCPETETHFLLSCPAYADLRCQFIHKKYYSHPSLFKMTLLLSCVSKTVIVGLSHYIVKAWKRRCDHSM